jgi:hypothetical protein
MQSDLINNIFSLFINRIDSFAVQKEDGQYFSEKHTLKQEDILEHLNHQKTIAIYQLDQESKIKWVCFDIDSYGAKEKAQILYNFIEEKTPFKGATLNEYTGGRGYHVWVFFNPKIPAFVGKAICSDVLKNIGFDCEIFPKQESLTQEILLGSSVRLPLGIHQKYKKISTLIQPSSLSDIVPAKVPNALINLLNNKKEASTNTDKIVTSIQVSNNDYKILRCQAIGEVLKGVKEGVRDEATFALARFYRELGLNSEETKVLLINWNEKNQPPLESNQLIKCINSAFKSGAKYAFGCNTFLDNNLLKSFCDKVNKTCGIKYIREKKKNILEVPELG